MRPGNLLKNRVVVSSVIIYSLAVAVLLATSIGGDSLPEEFPAPGFTLDNVFGGARVSLEGHGDGPVIIYFFASW